MLLTTFISTRDIHILHSAFSISSVHKSEELCDKMKITPVVFVKLWGFLISILDMQVSMLFLITKLLIDMSWIFRDYP